LYAVARELLSPGDRVIISPITCRTVIEALLAAGVVPVFVDIESETGNIDPRRLSDCLLRAARAIVTTNLYGNPDNAPEVRRAAAKHDLLFIEDCAHVVYTVIAGRRVGSIGDVSVFSFKKYFGEPGGVITFRDEAAARKVRTRVAAEAGMPPEAEERLRWLQLLAQEVTPPSTAAWLSRMGGSLRRLARISGSAQTAPPSPPQLSRPAFPLAASLAKVARRLSKVDLFIAERMSSVRDLVAQCPLPLRRSRWADDVCYFVVPFFSARRDSIIAALKLRGVPTYFLYTPPVSEVFQAQLPTRQTFESAAVDFWCRNILPVNPGFAREFVDVINTAGVRQ
jgi:dTDP-4-amino-4,6-dideoxygalactose transaminase